MNKDEFIRMLNVLQDGIYQDVLLGRFGDLSYEDALELTLNNLRIGVAGAKAEQWLREWEKGNPRHE